MQKYMFVLTFEDGSRTTAFRTGNTLLEARTLVMAEHAGSVHAQEVSDLTQDQVKELMEAQIPENQLSLFSTDQF